MPCLSCKSETCYQGYQNLRIEVLLLVVREYYNSTIHPSHFLDITPKYISFWGRKGSKLGVKKAQNLPKCAYLLINHNTNVIFVSRVTREVGKMKRWHGLTYHPNLLSFGECNGSKTGVEMAQNVPKQAYLQINLNIDVIFGSRVTWEVGEMSRWYGLTLHPNLPWFGERNGS